MVAKVIFRRGLSGAIALPISVFCMSGVAAQEAIQLPSGLEVTLQEVRFEEQMGRFRFIAPAIGPEGVSYMEVREDFPWLCAEMVVPVLTQTDRSVPEVVISLADREVTFGEITPGATQYFEVFSVSDGTCIWEEF